MANSSKKSPEHFKQLITTHLEQVEWESVKSCCSKALVTYPENVDILETCANAYLDLSEPEEAQPLLEKAIVLSPNEGPIKYFSLAQLLSGAEAAQSYSKGIELQEQLLRSLPAVDESTSTETRREHQRVLSNAYLSLGELYITDLCDEQNAEVNSENYFKLGIENDPSNPEAYQSLARLMIVKDQVDEAKTLMEQSLNLWLPEYSDSIEKDTDVNGCPLSYESRLTTVQTLMETKQFPLALEVLGTLLHEDEEDPYCLYLNGLCFYLDDERLTSKIYLEAALEANAASESLESSISDHIKSLLEELKDIDESDLELESLDLHDDSDESMED